MAEPIVVVEVLDPQFPPDNSLPEHDNSPQLSCACSRNAKQLTLGTRPAHTCESDKLTMRVALIALGCVAMACRLWLIVPRLLR